MMRMRIPGSLPLVPHSPERSFSADIHSDVVHDRYYLLGGPIHIKHFALIKHTWMLIYLLCMVKNDLVQQQLECFTLNQNVNMWQRTPCAKSICLWLNNIVGLLPSFLVTDASSICLMFLMIGIFGSLLMLIALLIREQARVKHTYPRAWIKFVMVFPSFIFEIFVSFVGYYAIFYSVHWRTTAPAEIMDNYHITRAVVFAIIIATVLLCEVMLHVSAMWYLCEFSSDDNTSSYNYQQSSSVLEMFKHPIGGGRSVNQKQISNGLSGLGVHGATAHRDSANVTIDSAGYGRLRRVVIAGSPEDTRSQCQSIRDRESDSVCRRYSPRSRPDADASCSSDYQQIRGEQFHHLPRANRSIPENSDAQDSTYLEVV